MLQVLQILHITLSSCRKEQGNNMHELFKVQDYRNSAFNKG